MRTAAIDHHSQEARERSLNHLGDFEHVALKGHRLVDESLGRIIAQHCRAPSVLDDLRMSFYVKTKLARALVGDPYDEMLWGLVWRLYLIYNDVAHKADSQRAKQLIMNLIEHKSRWKAQSLPAIASDQQMATHFRDSVESVLNALGAIEIQAQENAASRG